MMRVGRMMTECRMGAGLALALLLAGCHTTYRYSYEPSVQGEAKTQGKYYLRSCKVGDVGGDLSDVRSVDDNGKGDLAVALHEGFTREGLDRVQAAQPSVFANTGVPVDIIVRNNRDMRQGSLVGVSGFLALFSLGILPCWNHWDEEYRIQLLVEGGGEKTGCEFKMAEESREGRSGSGLNRLFPYQHRTDVRFTCEGSGCDSGGNQQWKARAACKVEAYAYAIAATLAQMERDGKLSGVAQRQALQEKPEAKDKEPAASGRALELRQLLDAGVISEDEYRREVDKVNGIK